MDTEADLLESFQCVKCRGRAGIAQEIILPASLGQMLTGRGVRYTALSCGLCGYTELYNPLAFAATEEALPKPVEIPQQS